MTCTALAVGLVAGSMAPALAGPLLLFDPANGAVLYAEDQDDAWRPASLTKIMTAYLTFEALKEGKITMDTKFKVSPLAFNQPPSRLGLPIGTEISVGTALEALIIKSANDIAMLLAEGVGGTEEAFVDRMNATAKRLGMTRTTFVNPNGLPADGQVTTARDLAKLTRAVLQDFPDRVPLWSQLETQIGKRHIANHNQLMKAYAGADGMKTGFTCDSGYNVVATATRDGHKLVAVVLGEPSGAARTLRAANLLEHGFQYRAWEGLQNPVTLDTLEVPPESATEAVSVRNFVPGPCGGHTPGSATVKRSRQKRLKNAQRIADANARKVVPVTVSGVAAGVAARSRAVTVPAAAAAKSGN